MLNNGVVSIDWHSSSSIIRKLFSVDHLNNNVGASSHEFSVQNAEDDVRLVEFSQLEDYPFIPICLAALFIIILVFLPLSFNYSRKLDHDNNGPPSIHSIQAKYIRERRRIASLSGCGRCCPCWPWFFFTLDEAMKNEHNWLSVCTQDGLSTLSPPMRVVLIFVYCSCTLVLSTYAYTTHWSKELAEPAKILIISGIGTIFASFIALILSLASPYYEEKRAARLRHHAQQADAQPIPAPAPVHHPQEGVRRPSRAVPHPSPAAVRQSERLEAPQERARQVSNLPSRGPSPPPGDLVVPRIPNPSVSVVAPNFHRPPSESVVSAPSVHAASPVLSAPRPMAVSVSGPFPSSSSVRAQIPNFGRASSAAAPSPHSSSAQQNNHLANISKTVAPPDYNAVVARESRTPPPQRSASPPVERVNERFVQSGDDAQQRSSRYGVSHYRRKKDSENAAGSAIVANHSKAPSFSISFGPGAVPSPLPSPAHHSIQPPLPSAVVESSQERGPGMDDDEYIEMPRLHDIAPLPHPPTPPVAPAPLDEDVDEEQHFVYSYAVENTIEEKKEAEQEMNDPPVLSYQFTADPSVFEYQLDAQQDNQHVAPQNDIPSYPDNDADDVVDDESENDNNLDDLVIEEQEGGEEGEGDVGDGGVLSYGTLKPNEVPSSAPSESNNADNANNVTVYPLSADSSAPSQPSLPVLPIASTAPFPMRASVPVFALAPSQSFNALAPINIINRTSQPPIAEDDQQDIDDDISIAVDDAPSAPEAPMIYANDVPISSAGAASFASASDALNASFSSVSDSSSQLDVTVTVVNAPPAEYSASAPNPPSIASPQSILPNSSLASPLSGNLLTATIYEYDNADDAASGRESMGSVLTFEREDEEKKIEHPYRLSDASSLIVAGFSPNYEIKQPDNEVAAPVSVINEEGEITHQPTPVLEVANAPIDEPLSPQSPLIVVNSIAEPSDPSPPPQQFSAAAAAAAPLERGEVEGWGEGEGEGEKDAENEGEGEGAAPIIIVASSGKNEEKIDDIPKRKTAAYDPTMEESASSNNVASLLQRQPIIAQSSAAAVSASFVDDLPPSYHEALAASVHEPSAPMIAADAAAPMIAAISPSSIEMASILPVIDERKLLPPSGLVRVDEGEEENLHQEGVPNPSAPPMINHEREEKQLIIAIHPPAAPAAPIEEEKDEVLPEGVSLPPFITPSKHTQPLCSVMVQRIVYSLIILFIGGCYYFTLLWSLTMDHSSNRTSYIIAELDLNVQERWLVTAVLSCFVDIFITQTIVQFLRALVNSSYLACKT